MEKITLSVPAMFGDHHVLEVRRLLSGLAGVEHIYASSSFQLVDVTYDPAQIDPEAITATLSDAGYMEPLDIPLEPETAAYQSSVSTLTLRHTAAYRQTGRTVTFARNVAYAGRPLWPCPGMGPLSTDNEGE